MIKPMKKQWDLEQVQLHIKGNSKETYSMAVVLAALYMKLYGELPKMGLSGFQAEAAEGVSKVLPDKL